MEVHRLVILDEETNEFKSSRERKSKGQVTDEATHDTFPIWSTSGALFPRVKERLY